MASMIMEVLSNFGLGNVALIVLIFSLFIDLTPGIKFNPIKWIIKQFGDAFNNSIDKKVDQMKTEVSSKMDAMNEDLSNKIDVINDEIKDIKKRQIEQEKSILRQEKEIDVAEVNRLKQEILNFSNRLFRKQKFTSEEYRTVMDSYTRYENIIEKYDDLQNGKIKIEYEIIIKHYEEHKDDGEYMF
ncbi:MAG: hypothetical protein NC548_15930 [Lachnospiraceae bacterium]|nr:hypothetical protein [Lachnospiraceae bacterium]